MNHASRYLGKRVFILTYTILLLGFLILHFFNIDYRPVTGGIDPAWQYIINDAAQKHLEFIFTAGPYGFLCYPLPVGSNLEIAIMFRLLVWLCFSAFFSYLVATRYFSLENVSVFAFLLAVGSTLPFDYYLSFLILFLLFFAFSARKWYVSYTLAISLATLLCFIRFSPALIALSSCGAFICLTVFFDRTKAFRALLIMVVGVPVLFSALYLVYNPSFSGMLRFIRGAFEISAEYSVAMSIPGGAIARWLALVVVLTYLMLMGVLSKNKETAFFLAILAIPPMFGAFKHGFVRQNGQVTYFFMFIALVMGLILLFTHLHKRMRWVVVLPIPVVLICFFGPVRRINFSNILGVQKLITMVELINYAQTKDTLQAMSQDALQEYRLPHDWVQSIGEHSVSIFPWEAAYAPANHLNYKLWPVIQAYAAYTPYLDQLNAQHLDDPNAAPEYVLMEWFAVDGRHALIDVPAMWLMFYKWYDVERPLVNPFPLYLLKRRMTPRFQQIETGTRRPYQTDEFIEIPVSDHPVVMKLSMKLNLLGTLAKIFFRVPRTDIELVGTAGYISYRVVPETLIDGLLINFLPISLQDVEFLMNEDQARAKLYGFKLSGAGLRFYANTIQVEFAQITDIRIPDVRPRNLTALSQEPAGTHYEVNYIYTYPQPLPTTDHTPSFLIVGGWALDTRARDVAGGVYLEIDGKLYPAYYGFPRDDVVKHFGESGYRSGFQAGIPVSAIGKGPHTLALKVLTKDGQSYYTPPETFRVEIK
jgi:hypothetical protein